MNAFSLPALLGLLLLLAGCPQKEKSESRVIHTLEQLNAPGCVIGVPDGAASITVAEQKFPRAQIRYFNSLADGYTAVKYGRLDGFLFDSHNMEYMVLQNPELALFPEKVADEAICVGLPQNAASQTLVKELNGFIARCRADGTYADMRKRWFTEKNAVMPGIPEAPNPARTLKVGTEGLNEPMNFFGRAGEITGFDVEFARRMALALNARLELVTMPYPGLVAAVESGRIDMLIANLNNIPSRRESILFSDEYIDSDIRMMILRERLPGTRPDVSAEGPTFAEKTAASFERTFLRDDRWKMILDGLGVTITITLASALLGTLLAFAVCLMRRSKKALLKVPARWFVQFMQGTPILVILMILYYVVFAGTAVGAISIAVIGFGLNFAACVSEMMRTGVDGIERGQLEAAEALGLGKFAIFRKIIFPQAARRILPLYRGEFINMLKMTSIVGYIAIQDLTKMTDIIRSRTYESFFPLVATAAIYFITAHLLASLLTLAEFKIEPANRKRTTKGVVLK